MANRPQKRPRSPECEECLPISKRINNLQIDQGYVGVDRQQSKDERQDMKAHQSSDLSSSQPSCSTQQNLSMTPCHDCVGNNNLPYDIVQGYNPELTDNENPQYYNINNTLFKAHFDRVARQRTNIQYPNS